MEQLYVRSVKDWREGKVFTWNMSFDWNQRVRQRAAQSWQKCIRDDTWSLAGRSRMSESVYPVLHALTIIPDIQESETQWLQPFPGISTGSSLPVLISR